ncbi:MAG: hypothetical protein HY280_06585 [Nitrospinae bacterium]|nr:hypothetical protein [Nitrospinota bacterium]
MRRIISIAMVALFIAACAKNPPPPQEKLDKEGVRQRADESHRAIGK